MIVTENLTQGKPFSILAVDDDPEILENLEQDMVGAGFKVSVAYDGDTGLELIKSEKPDLVILDVNMPCMNGLEICELLRKDRDHYEIPIILLSGRGMDIDRIHGLETGADDYVTKPYNSRELLLRIKSILWRVYGKDPKDTITLGDLFIDFAAYQVWVEEELISLTRTEFQLLAALAEQPGRLKSREFLLDRVWGHSEEVFSRTVDTHIQRLRNKLQKAGRYIETVRGFGYRFNF